MGVRMLPKYDCQTKIDPGGWGCVIIAGLLWCRCARASARFFLCLRASRSVLTPPFENCVPLWAGRTVELLPKLKPAAGCPQRTRQFIFLLLDSTRSLPYDKGRAAAQPSASLPPLVNLPGSGFRESQQKKHCQAREAGSSLVAVFHTLGGGSSWHGRSKIGSASSIIIGGSWRKGWRCFTGSSSFCSSCRPESSPRSCRR